MLEGVSGAVRALAGQYHFKLDQGCRIFEVKIDRCYAKCRFFQLKNANLSLF